MLSNVFSVSDEAFALMIVENYEKRWKLQLSHTDKKLWKTDPCYQAKYTSSSKGVHKNAWSDDGIKRFFDWCRTIKDLRSKEKSGVVLENEILAYFCGFSKNDDDTNESSEDIESRKSSLVFEEFVEDGWQNLLDSTKLKGV